MYDVIPEYSLRFQRDFKNIHNSREVIFDAISYLQNLVYIVTFWAHGKFWARYGKFWARHGRFWARQISRVGYG